MRRVIVHLVANTGREGAAQDAYLRILLQRFTDALVVPASAERHRRQRHLR